MNHLLVKAGISLACSISAIGIQQWFGRTYNTGCISGILGAVAAYSLWRMGSP